MNLGIPANSTNVLLIKPPDASSNETEPVLTMIGGRHIVGAKGDHPGREVSNICQCGEIIYLN